MLILKRVRCHEKTAKVAQIVVFAFVNVRTKCAHAPPGFRRSPAAKQSFPGNGIPKASLWERGREASCSTRSVWSQRAEISKINRDRTSLNQTGSNQFLVTKLLLCNGIVLEAPASRARYRARPLPRKLELRRQVRSEGGPLEREPDRTFQISDLEKGVVANQTGSNRLLHARGRWSIVA
jgi:hypothetical protein